jgi:ubiquinone/menaquinone biosynthesis C-methylase UbiE
VVDKVDNMPPTFDERAEWFDAHYATTRGRMRLALVLERIIEAIPPPPARILDAGGGSGAVAIQLAERGYEVTLLDPSEGMLRVARDRVEAAGVDLAMINAGIEDVPSLAPGPFDVVCCHAVLMYVDDPAACLGVFRSIVEPGAVLSLLEKNRDGLAMRPGLIGEFEEALRVLDDPIASGNLGIRNRARTFQEWRGLLEAAGWRSDSWVGIRLFSDLANEELPPERFEQLLRLEREAGRRDAYRSVARLIHISATAT